MKANEFLDIKYLLQQDILFFQEEKKRTKTNKEYCRGRIEEAKYLLSGFEEIIEVEEV